MRSSYKFLAYTLCTLFLASPLFAIQRTFNLTNTMTPQGVKVWLPGTLVVKKGDSVTLHLNNKLKVAHGFAIVDDHGKALVKEIVVGPEKKAAPIMFTALTAGIYTLKCHMHPAHVGGQFIVID